MQRENPNDTEIIRLASGLLRYTYRPVRFVYDILKARPDPWQAEAMHALAKGEHVAIRSGHGVGKTALLAWIVLWFLTTRPYPKIPCTAPTQHQLSDLLWAEISYWLTRGDLGSILTWTASRVALTHSEENWFAVARTSNKPENLAGFHAKHLLYVVDEGSGVEDEIMQVVDGALTTEGALVCMAGNPTRIAGYFHAAFHKNQEFWHKIHISSEDSPRVSKSYCIKMANTWGRDTDIYRIRVKGDFAKQETDTFIPIDIVEKAVVRFEGNFRFWDSTVEMGIDVARYGDDETVFTIRKGGRVIIIERRRGWDTVRTATRALLLARMNKVKAIYIDDQGAGGGVVDILEHSDEVTKPGSHLSIVARNFGGEGDDIYLNTSSLMWGNLKKKFENGLIAVPNEDDLIAQLTTRKFKVNTKGKIVLERKEDMKNRELPSPDLADSLALCFSGDVRFGSQKLYIPRSRRGRSREGMRVK